MTIKIALENENGKNAIAVYKDGDIKSHFWLENSDDEYRIFEIVSYTIRKLEGW